MSLHSRQRAFCVGLACAVPLLNVAIWIGVALRPPPPPPPVAWSLPQALLSALTPSSTTSTPSTEPSVAPPPPSSTVTRPVRPAPLAKPSPRTPGARTDIVNPWERRE
jgi:hypothetical protein